MAINPNNSLKAEHTAYTAMTGGGKSVAVQYMGRIPKFCNLAIFDPYGDYLWEQGNKAKTGFAGTAVHHYETRASFARAFASAWKSGKHFKVAYKPKKPSREEMLWFCTLMWEAGNGNRILHMLVEELSKWTPSSGKEPSDSKLGECLTGGRKFGLIFHGVFQTPTEVPKTITKQCKHKVVGMQDDRGEAERMAKECDINWRDIATLEPLTYIHKKPGVGNLDFLDLSGIFSGGKPKTSKFTP